MWTRGDKTLGEVRRSFVGRRGSREGKKEEEDRWKEEEQEGEELKKLAGEMNWELLLRAGETALAVCTRACTPPNLGAGWS